MKRSEIFFSAILVPVDFLMIVLAAASAYFLRLMPIFQNYVSRVFNLSFNDYVFFSVVVAPLFILILALDGLYNMRATRRAWQELYGVARAITIGLIILMVAVFLQREWFSSRFVILVGWALAVFYVVTARFIIQRIQKWLLVHEGMGMHRVLLIGTNKKMYAMKRLFTRNKELGYRVVDQIDTASVVQVKEIRQDKDHFCCCNDHHFNYNVNGFAPLTHSHVIMFDTCIIGNSACVTAIATVEMERN